MDPGTLITQTAQQYGVDPDLANAIAFQGEGFGKYLGADAQSGKGALGTMQLMPGTAKDLGVDPTDPTQNIVGGIKYIRQLQDRFGAAHPDLIAASYNAGPEAVAKYNGVPPFHETQAYVSRVTGALGDTLPDQGKIDAAFGGTPQAQAAPAPVAQPAQPAAADDDELPDSAKVDAAFRGGGVTTPPDVRDLTVSAIPGKPGPAVPPVQKTPLPPAELAPGTTTQWADQKPGVDFKMTPDVMRLSDGRYQRAGPSGEGGAWQGGDVAISPVTGQFQVLSPQDALDFNRPSALGPSKGPSPLEVVDAFGRNLANTLTGGWADKLQAAFDAHDEASFSAELDRQKRLDAVRQSEAPVTSAFGGLTGLAGQAFLTPEMGGKAFLGSTANNAAIGAGYGALQGSGNARGDAGDWWNQTYTGAAGGALFGTGLGAGLGAVAPSARWAFRGVKSAAAPFIAAASEGAAEAQAGARLAAAATDLPATRNALEGVTELVLGSKPTTFQATGDMGVGALERGVRAKNPEPFKQREADQNEKRVEALQGVQSGANPADLGNFVSGQFDQIDADTQAAVDKATQAAQAKTGAIGGTATPEAQGADLRGAITDAETTARQREGALWQAIDPDGKLTGNVAATVKAAKDIPSGLPATAKPPVGEEAAIYEAAQGMSPVSPVSDLIALRSRVSTAMRQELVANGRSPAYARLAQFRGAIQDNLSQTISDKVGADDAAVQAGTLPQAQSARSRLDQIIADASAAGESVRLGGTTLVTGQAGGRAVAASGGGGTASAAGGQPPGPVGNPQGPSVPSFDAAAQERLAAATAATKARAATFGVRPVSTVTATTGQQGAFRLPDGSVPGKFFHSGPSGFNDVQAAVKAGGDAAQGVLEDYAASDLRKAAGNPDGTIDPKRFAAWQAKNADALRALGPDAQSRFADAASAGQAVADAATARVAALKAAKTGALGKLIGVADPDSVTRVVGGILRSPTAADQIGAMADATRANPDAFQGLRQAVADHISNTLIGNTEVGTSGAEGIKADAFQTFMTQNRGALAKVFSPEELTTLDNIAADIQQAKRSDNALKLAGSNTTQDTAASAKIPKAAGQGATVLLDMLGGAIGTGLGMAHGGGPMGGVIGEVGGTVTTHVLQMLRSVGINRVNDLVTQALLNPEVARRLLAKVPADPAAQNAALQGLVTTLRKGVVAAGPAAYQAAQPKGVNLSAFGQVAPRRPILSLPPRNAFAGAMP